jgi:hypothetical protein
VRCKLCKTTFRTGTPISAPDTDFEDTVFNWLVEADEAEATAVPRPRIVSSENMATTVQEQATRNWSAATAESLEIRGIAD